MKKILSSLFASIVILAAFTGCAGYRLGSMLPPDIKSVYVPTFVNRTTEPMIENQTTSETIRKLQEDGSLKVVGKEDADAILEVTLRNYELEPLAYNEQQKTTANEYRIRITAAIVLKRLSNNEIVAEAPFVQGEGTFFVEGDFTSSKQRGLPEAAADLGQRIITQVVEAW